jgi:hypothetical protein
MKKGFIISLICVVFFMGSAVGVYAGTQFKEVKALFYPSVKVELNGQEASSIKALKYDGSLYLSMKSFSDFFGLNETLKYDSKTNKVTIGGPKYVNVVDAQSDNFYQVIVNGNWGSSTQTNSRQVISNYYMGIDFNLAVKSDTSLDEYCKNLLANDLQYISVVKQTDTTIYNAQAKVIDYKSSDTVGRLAIIHKDSDFVTINFFVDKTRFKESDYKEYEKIIKSFNIQ